MFYTKRMQFDWLLQGPSVLDTSPIDVICFAGALACIFQIINQSIFYLFHFSGLLSSCFILSSLSSWEHSWLVLLLLSNTSLLHESGDVSQILLPAILTALNLIILSSRDSIRGICTPVWSCTVATIDWMQCCWVNVYGSIIGGGGERLAGLGKAKLNAKLHFYEVYLALPTCGMGIGRLVLSFQVPLLSLSSCFLLWHGSRSSIRQLCVGQRWTFLATTCLLQKI